MASPNLSELVTTTLRDRQGELADNVSNSNALLSVMNARGQVELIDGGRTIVRELEYAENSTFQYYSGYETLNISPSDVFSAAEYAWRQAAVNVSWSGLENRVQNAGDAASIRLVASRIRNAEKTMANQISVGIYSDGTGSGGRQIDGLQAQVADTPTTGTVGGINRANFAFWRNQTVTVTDSASAVELNADMRDLWIACSRGSDSPNVIVFGAALYDTFWGDLQGIQRVTSSGGGTAIKGFSALEYRGVPVLLDGGQAQTGPDWGGGLNGNRGYFLNTDYLFWSVHSATNMVPMDQKMSLNQDATVVPLLWAGNLTMSNAGLQGVLV
jgi:hypothetical protein